MKIARAPGGHKRFMLTKLGQTESIQNILDVLLGVANNLQPLS